MNFSFGSPLQVDGSGSDSCLATSVTARRCQYFSSIKKKKQGLDLKVCGFSWLIFVSLKQTTTVLGSNKINLCILPPL